MSSHWDFYLADLEGQPTSFYLNLSLIQQAPLKGYGLLAIVRVPLREPNELGMTTTAETMNLFDLEDSIVKIFNKPEETLWVGRTTGNSVRTFYFYNKDQVEGLVDPHAHFSEKLAQVMAKHEDYDYEAEIFEDVAWETYRDFLYPDPYTMQELRNRKVLEVLEERGDKMEVAREISHWVYFPDVEKANRFAEKVKEEGFTLRLDPVENGGRYGVQFYREDVPSADRIDEITFELQKLANAYGGDYDGWETKIIFG